MNSILLLTSTNYICLSKNNIVHKLCEMFQLKQIYIISNSTCKFINHTEKGLSSLQLYCQIVDIIIILYTDIPFSSTCDNVDDELILNIIPNIQKKPIIYFDYFEKSWNNKSNHNQLLLREEPFIHNYMFKISTLYFKRELYDDLKLKGLLSFPEPTFRDTFNEQPNKIYDIFCSFPQKYTGLRLVCIEVCNRLKNEGYNIIIKDDCNDADYIRLVKHSYITLDAWGAGQINHRFLEIIALRSVCCRQRYTVSFYKDYDNNMIIEYNSLNELYYNLKYFLQRKDLLLQMEHNANKHYLKYHTKEKISDYIYNQINNQINNNS